MERINYFHAHHLIVDVLDKTGIDFGYEDDHKKKFENLTKQEARELKRMITNKPHLLKNYVYKNIINDKPF
jgi:hypothetical protein